MVMLTLMSTLPFICKVGIGIWSGVDSDAVANVDAEVCSERCNLARLSPRSSASRSSSRSPSECTRPRALRDDDGVVYGAAAARSRCRRVDFVGLKIELESARSVIGTMNC